MEIRFGIIGCGYIGNRHAKRIVENNEARLMKVYDDVPQRGRELAARYHASAVSSLDALLNPQEIDIVSVCTPNGNHFDSAMNVLKAGIGVLIEKPMTIRSRDAKALIDEATRRGKDIFVVKQNRYNAPVQAVKELVEAGKLGRVFMVVVNCYWNRNTDYYNASDWKGTKALDGGTLFTQFSHFVDIMYYLFGDVTNISGLVTNANHRGLIEFEDTGAFSFNFLNGALGALNYTTTSYEVNMEGSITVFAENATIKIGGQYLNTIEYQRTNGFDIPELPDQNPANDYGYYQGSMSNHDQVIRNVVEALNGRSPIMTSAADGMKVVEIIERMYAAAKPV